MRVYTIAGNPAIITSGDGGPATSAAMVQTEGIWVDGNCNLYISEGNHIRKVNLRSGIISTVAGTAVGSGYSGDGGPATNAKIHRPYGLYSDVTGNIYIADLVNNVIRKVDAITGLINTFAGGGTSVSDGVPATNALINSPVNVYGDSVGNIYIAELGRIRKVNGTTGIITTFAGTGVFGLSGDGGQAVNAQLSASGMIFDALGNFYFADRGNHRIRKIDGSTGIITTFAGTTDGYSGDGGPATAAQLSGPISLAIDSYGNIIISDNQNNVIRKVDANTSTITTIAGMGPSGLGSISEGALASTAYMHPEFIYLDLSGNIYFSTFGPVVRKITNYNPGLGSSGSSCIPNDVNNVLLNAPQIKIHPNPTTNLLTIAATNPVTSLTLTNLLGQTVYSQEYNSDKIQIDVSGLSPGIYLIKINGTEVRRFVKE